MLSADGCQQDEAGRELEESRTSNHIVSTKPLSFRIGFTFQPYRMSVGAWLSAPS